jgi:hypothetical protein
MEIQYLYGPSAKRLFPCYTAALIAPRVLKRKPLPYESRAAPAQNCCACHYILARGRGSCRRLPLA